MGSVNCASLRDESDAYKADIASLRKEGKITKEVGMVLTGLCNLCSLLEILIAVFLEKTTKKPERTPASLHRKPTRMRLGSPLKW